MLVLKHIHKETIKDNFTNLNKNYIIYVGKLENKDEIEYIFFYLRIIILKNDNSFKNKIIEVFENIFFNPFNKKPKVV